MVRSIMRLYLYCSMITILHNPVCYIAKSFGLSEFCLFIFRICIFIWILLQPVGQYVYTALGIIQERAWRYFQFRDDFMEVYVAYLVAISNTYWDDILKCLLCCVAIGCENMFEDWRRKEIAFYGSVLACGWGMFQSLAVQTSPAIFCWCLLSYGCFFINFFIRNV